MKQKPISSYKCANRCGNQASVYVLLNKVCSYECAAKLAIKKDKKNKESERLKQARETRKEKQAAKTRTKLFQALQKEVNFYVLHVRDKGRPCCTCGKSSPDVKYDAGHYRSVGSCKELRFNLFNIHKQCSVNCNQWGSGMRAEYREFIKEVYGQKTLEWLDGPHKSLKEQFPTSEDIRNEIKVYQKLNLEVRRDKRNG